MVPGDPDQAQEYLSVAQQSLPLQVTALTCFTGGQEGPNGWGLKADAHRTAVGVHKG